MKIGWFFPSPLLHRLANKILLPYYNFDSFLPSVWIRCLQLIPELDKLGISSFFNQRKIDCDIAIFLRDFSTPIQAIINYQRANGAKIAIDLCTNPFDVTGLLMGRYGMTQEKSQAILAAIAKCDGILCASDFIAKRAQGYSPLVTHIPDSIDKIHYCHKKKVTLSESTRLCAIWAGVSSKAHHLEKVTALLTQHDIGLDVISDKRPTLSIPFRFTKWSYNSSPQTLLKGDIAISPRELTNLYDLGHSHFKIGVFMAQGIPALASPVPSYEQLIARTKGGIIANTTSDWSAALEELQSNRALLKELGDAAFSGMQQFSTEEIAGQYVEFFEALMGSRSAKSSQLSHKI
jgi:hypothetical protein